jgi:hypothetical protein
VRWLLKAAGRDLGPVDERTETKQREHRPELAGERAARPGACRTAPEVGGREREHAQNTRDAVLGVGGGVPALLGERRERSAPVKSLARMREELLLGYCA